MRAKQKISYEAWEPVGGTKRNRRAFDVNVNGNPSGGFIERDLKTGKWLVPFDNDDDLEKAFRTRIAAARYVIGLGRRSSPSGDNDGSA